MKKTSKMVKFLAKFSVEEREFLRSEGYRLRSNSTAVLREIVASVMKRIEKK